MFNLSYFFRSILLIAIILLSTVKMYAQDEEIEQNKNIFKISPQSLIASTFFISYERYLATGTSFQISGGILSAQRNSSDNISYSPINTTSSKSYDKANGGIVEGMVKFYFLKGRAIMSGLYAGPYGRYSNNRFRIHNNYNSPNSNTIPHIVDYRIETYEGGVVIGYQFVIKNVFVMDLFTGGGVKSSNNTSPATYTTRSFDLLESQDYNGVVPKAGFRLGFAF